MNEEIKVVLSSGFILVLAVFFFFDNGGWLLPALAAVTLHELGHLSVLLMFRCTPDRLEAGCTGLSISYNSAHLSVGAEAVSLAAGPVANIIAAALLSLRPQLLAWAWMQLLLGCFNLLPAREMDGGRLLLVLLQATLPPRAARLICNIADLLVIILLSMGTAMFFFGKQTASTMPCIALWLIFARVLAMYKSRRYNVKN